MKKVWTKEKIEKLTELWELYSDKELGKILQVSDQAVNAERRRLKLFRKEKHLNNTKIYTYDEVHNLFQARDYTLIEDEYINYTTKMQYICNKHKGEGVQQISLCDFLRGRGCYYCGREKTISCKMNSDDYYKKECQKRDFTYVGRRIDNKNQCSIIQYICNKHSDVGIQEKLVGNFEKTSGCPFCNIKKNENNLKNILINWGYNFKSQKTFYDCRDKNPLPFDFYLSDFNVCIEFDGEFHYFPIRKGNMTDTEAQIAYEKTVKHDQIKTEYCKNNKIPLIRIPYWKKENMEHYLWNEFVKLKLIIDDQEIITT